MRAAQADGRIESLDVLRGVAILGILVGNMAQYFLPKFLADHPASLVGDPTTDLIAWSVVRVLVDGKFLTLFSFLFGISFAILLERMGSRGDGRLPLARRLISLFAFGVLHATLFYYADVLTAYAIAGLLLWPTMRLKPRTQVWVGVVLLGLTVGPWNYLVSGEGEGASSLPAAIDSARMAYVESRGGAAVSELDERAIDALTETTAFRDGPWSASLAMRLQRYGDIAMVLIFYVLWRSLGLFMIGAGLFRSGWLRDRSASFWTRTAAVCLSVGVGTGSFLAFLVHAEFLAPAGRAAPIAVAQELVTLVTAAGFAALVFRLCMRERTSVIGAGLGAVGRTALTNYIGQSLVMSLIATHIGAAMFGELSRMALLGLAGGFFVVQVLASRAWLERYRMGPLEWLWRCFTYLRWIPNRV